MATLAQLTDLHLLEDNYAERPIGPRARLSYLSFGRSLDPLSSRCSTRRDGTFYRFFSGSTASSSTTLPALSSTDVLSFTSSTATRTTRRTAAFAPAKHRGSFRPRPWSTERRRCGSTKL